jgi:hypothetical protein
LVTPDPQLAPPPEGPAEGDGELLGQAFYRDGDLPAAAVAEQRSRLHARHVLGSAVLVVALLTTFDLTLRWLLPPEILARWMQGEPAAYTVKIDHFRRAPAPDVLFLGSSRVRDAVVPDVVEAELAPQWRQPPRTYNLGLVNAKAEEYLSIVRDHLPDPPPRYVVLGVTGSELIRPWNFVYASRFLWTASGLLDYLRRTDWEHFEAIHVEYFLEGLVARGWYLFGQRDALRALLIESLEQDPPADLAAKRAERRRAQLDYLLADDGYERTEPDSAETLAARLRHDPEGVRVPARELNRDPSQLVEARVEELALMAAELARRGSRLALVETPVSPWLQTLNPVLHGPAFRERAAALCAELGIVWVPMPPERTLLDDNSYLDVNHLTEPGARRYSRLLVRELLQAGFFEEPAR